MIYYYTVHFLKFTCNRVLSAYHDIDEDLSPGEPSPQLPMHSMAQKGRVGQGPKAAANGLGNALDLGEKSSAKKKRCDWFEPVTVSRHY